MNESEFKLKFIKLLCESQNWEFIEAKAFDCTNGWFQLPFYVSPEISDDDLKEAYKAIYNFIKDTCSVSKVKPSKIIGHIPESKLFFVGYTNA